MFLFNRYTRKFRRQDKAAPPDRIQDPSPLRPPLPLRLLLGHSELGLPVGGGYVR